MEAWLMTQGGWGAAVLGLIAALGAIWRSREALLARREEDIKILYAALNASTNASEATGEVIRSITTQFGAYSQLAALRAQAFDEFSRRTDANFQKLDK